VIQAQTSDTLLAESQQQVIPSTDEQSHEVSRNAHCMLLKAEAGSSRPVEQLQFLTVIRACASIFQVSSLYAGYQDKYFKFVHDSLLRIYLPPHNQRNINIYSYVFL